MNQKFNGERLVLGSSPRRMEADHMARYEFAKKFCLGKSVLDIACGTGYGSHMLLNAGAVKVVGVDISKDAVCYAEKEFASMSLTFKVGNIQNNIELDFVPDLITCFETIEHVDDWKAAIRSIKDLVSGSSCTLLMSSPNRRITSPSARLLSDKPRNKFHVREFLLGELVSALEGAGFKVVESFGQRHQPLFYNATAQKIFQRLFKPHILSSSKLSKSMFFEPTYFVLVATMNRQESDGLSLKSNTHVD